MSFTTKDKPLTPVQMQCRHLVPDVTKPDHLVMVLVTLEQLQELHSIGNVTSTSSMSMFKLHSKARKKFAVIGPNPKHGLHRLVLQKTPVTTFVNVCTV